MVWRIRSWQSRIYARNSKKYYRWQLWNWIENTYIRETIQYQDESFTLDEATTIRHKSRVNRGAKRALFSKRLFRIHGKQMKTERERVDNHDHKEDWRNLRSLFAVESNPQFWMQKPEENEQQSSTETQKSVCQGEQKGRAEAVLKVQEYMPTRRYLHDQEAGNRWGRTHSWRVTRAFAGAAGGKTTKVIVIRRIFRELQVWQVLAEN